MNGLVTNTLFESRVTLWGRDTAQYGHRAVEPPPPRPTHQLGDALLGLARLLHRPVDDVALGHLLGHTWSTSCYVWRLGLSHNTLKWRNYWRWERIPERACCRMAGGFQPARVGMARWRGAGRGGRPAAPTRSAELRVPRCRSRGRTRTGGASVSWAPPPPRACSPATP